MLFGLDAEKPVPLLVIIRTFESFEASAASVTSRLSIVSVALVAARRNLDGSHLVVSSFV